MKLKFWSAVGCLFKLAGAEERRKLETRMGASFHRVTERLQEL